ncbi:amino acid/amide ABC transporter membrane protein 2 (HAAT family) [Micromonospora pisi]|uniref:Amino acid/amide ABC transporter membrane protein 2 (HAAT family) n=1 Tax=Micromonospora pisi TaxID=589240 RepID=A0A495JWN1_9ACTN|nr:branched-chain amino acid ABC transporter permease [Micromonospora pisi]RKR92965.1 amino acid/amide ABC transporter membrane protein 2 (HAAT family) [Micromonospora pisi]
MSPRVIRAALIVAALAAYPMVFTGSAAHNIGILALTFGIAATGWNLLGGYAGQVSFGHALYFGTGAYTTALLVRDGWSPWLSIAVSLPLAALIAAVVGYPCFRLRHHYYSIATIAVAEIVFILVTNLPGLGQASGWELPVVEPSLANLQFSLLDKRPYYYVALGFFGLAAVAVWLFLGGRAGSYVRAIRDDQAAAAAVGINVRRYKLAAAALSGAITALAGGFYVMYVLFVDPPSGLGLDLSVSFTLMAVLGGVGRFWGPLLGAWVLVFVQDATRQEFSGSGRSVDLLLYGALIVLVSVTEPGGLLAIGRRARAAVARWLTRARRPARDKTGAMP